MAARTAARDSTSFEVLALVAEGCSNRVIGKRRLMSPNTAANHVSAVHRKTGTSNRAEAAAYAIRHGLTAPNPD
jgi:DNA-binding NarL/FixJ family response regulator